MAKKSAKQQPVKESNTDEVLDSSTSEPMCMIPQAALNQVYHWLNSDNIPMPQNEVRHYMNLLLTAKLVKFAE